MQVVVFVLVSYPIVGGCAFIVSAVYYHLFLERRDRPRYLEHGEPFVTIMVPAHNEEQSIEQTVDWLQNKMNYPADRYEILVVDDASADKTPQLLAGLQQQYPDNLRVITIVKNRGKSHASNVAIGYAKGDFVLCNDADTRPNPNALWQYLSYFEREGGQNVGAVTGNMLAANRTTMVALAQFNELNSIIGLIKRSQMAYGGLFAFSGANTMYRKQAIFDVGGWHAEQPTEDIAIAWDMQRAGWRALFAPAVRFFLDVPENLGQLVKQRKRWSSGGIYVLLTKSADVLKNPIKHFRMLPIILDYGTSIIWSFFYWVSMAIFLYSQVVFAAQRNWERFNHNWYMVGIFVAVEMGVGMLQLLTSSYFNDRGSSLKYLLFAPWYMLVYWMVNTWTICYMFVPTLRKVLAHQDGGKWKSPERSLSLQASQPAGRRQS